MGRSSIIQLHDGSTSAKNKYILHDIDVLNVHNTHIFQNQQKQDYQIKIKGLCKKQTIDMKRNKNLSHHTYFSLSQNIKVSLDTTSINALRVKKECLLAGKQLQPSN